MDDNEFRRFIDQLKDKADLAQVISETGGEYKIDTRRRGKYLVGITHESLTVDPDKQIYTWFSKTGRSKSGNETGDVFSWLERYRNMDFWAAALYLAEKYGVRVPSGVHPAANGENVERARAFRARVEAFEVACMWFEQQLWSNQAALKYAMQRGWAEETIRAHRLGYSAPDKASDLASEFAMYDVDVNSPEIIMLIGKRGGIKDWCQDQGIEGQTNWLEQDRIWGMVDFPRLVYPHIWRGRVMYFSSRNLKWDKSELVGEHDKSKKGFNPPRALSGERQRYFNCAFHKNADPIVIVEGQADAITLGQWNIPSVALMGLASDEQLVGMMGDQGRRYIALDNDERGNAARWKVAELFGPMCRLIKWPEQWEGMETKDVNDWLQAMVKAGLDYQVEGEGEIREARLKDRINQQTQLVQDYICEASTLIDELAIWVGEMKGAERDEQIKRVFGLISKMDRVERAQYRSGLVDKLNISIREFNDILKAAGEKEEKSVDMEVVETLGGYFDGWLLEYLYEPEKREGKLAYRDPQGKVDIAESLEIEGRRYVPKYPGSFIQREACLFASGLGQLKDTRELVTIVEGFIRRWYLLESRYIYRLIAYYVLMTWVYDAFSALCYLRATGEAGAGKSELMRRIGPICYRFMPASGSTSPSSFFRAIEEYKGTLFIDEADLKDGGDMSNDFVKVLNLGAMKGGHIWRMEEVIRADGQREYEVASFNTFGPKLIAMRKEFRDDAVASRSLTLKLMPREPLELKLAKVPLVVNEEFKQQALGLRNMLMRWRLQVWQEEISMVEEDMDLEISARLNQVTMPLKALAREDGELRKEIERFLREYNREIVLSKSMTLAARVVEAMWKIYRYPDLRKKYLRKNESGAEYMMIGEVRKIANELIDEMNEPDKKEGNQSQKGQEGEQEEEQKGRKWKRDELSARGVGAIIRLELQLRVGNRQGKGFPVYWDEIKMEALAKRYGFDIKTLPEEGAEEPPEMIQEELIP
jgi:DNA primase